MKYFRLLDHQNHPTEYYVNERQAHYLGDIQQFNIIVGANNTRKSRFIRQIINTDLKVIIETQANLNALTQDVSSLFEDMGTSDTYLIDFGFDTPPEANEHYSGIKDIVDRLPGKNNELKKSDIKRIVEDINKQISTVSVNEQIKGLYNTIRATTDLITLSHQIYLNHQRYPRTVSFDTMNSSSVAGIKFRLPKIQYLDEFEGNQPQVDFLAKVLNWLTSLSDLNIIESHGVKTIYIPVLRSSRTLEGGKPDIFSNTIKSQYKLKDNAKLSIETGLDLYDKIELARNGHRREREGFAAFEKFLGDVFFQSRLIDIIAVKGTDSNKHVKISIQGDKDDIPIHDLGDGIQALIILLLPIFTADNKAWVFIDEPENNLHPGYQNVFIRAISENKLIKEKELRFFINTHSNHILTESLLGSVDTEIFVFSRKDKESSAISAFDGNEQTTLEMLGVLNTSVLISNCSIWVEGITDRLYLRAFLKAFYQSKAHKGQEPIEGFQYSFVEYAGNNLIHYSFDHEISSENEKLGEEMKAFFINSNVFLLADSDFSKEDKHLFYDNIASRRNNFRYFKTEVPEIENILPNSILKSWLLEDIGANSEEVDNLFLIPNTNQKLGDYFNNKISNGKKPRKFCKPKEGGTLRSDYKSRLADFVHKGVSEKTITWPQLKESAILEQLLIELSSFIYEKNNR